MNGDGGACRCSLPAMVRVRRGMGLAMDFQEADRRYVELKRQFVAGTIGVDEFNAERQRIMVLDDEGHW